MLRPSAPGLAAGAIAVAMDVLYVLLIRGEGDDAWGEVLPFVVLIGGAGLAAVAGSVLGDPRLRASLLWPAAAVLTGIGLLAIFSIGVPLLAAGVLAGAAAARATRRGWAPR